MKKILFYKKLTIMVVIKLIVIGGTLQAVRGSRKTTNPVMKNQIWWDQTPTITLYGDLRRIDVQKLRYTNRFDYLTLKETLTLTSTDYQPLHSLNQTSPKIYPNSWRNPKTSLNYAQERNLSSSSEKRVPNTN